MLERHERVLYGEEGRPGLVKEVGGLKDWQSQIDAERRTLKALAIGIALGLGLNGLGIVAILKALGGI
jgi:hypothetical protein